MSDVKTCERSDVWLEKWEEEEAKGLAFCSTCINVGCFEGEKLESF